MDKLPNTEVTALDMMAVSQAQHHQRFISFSTREGRYGYKTMQRLAGAYTEDGVILHQHRQERLLNKKVGLYPEYLAFTHNLEGCPRQLLNYLLFYELDEEGGYRFNMQTRARFREFCQLMGGKRYSDGAIAKAHRTLASSNVTQNITRSRYMMNALFIGHGNEDMRRVQVNQYSKHLIRKERHTTLSFLPQYSIENLRAA